MQYASRPLPARRDLRPLAAQLNEAESGDATWEADAPGALTPSLGHAGESSLDPNTVIAALTSYLASAPPAWNPQPLGDQAEAEAPASV